MTNIIKFPELIKKEPTAIESVQLSKDNTPFEIAMAVVEACIDIEEKGMFFDECTLKVKTCRDDRVMIILEYTEEN